MTVSLAHDGRGLEFTPIYFFCLEPTILQTPVTSAGVPPIVVDSEQMTQKPQETGQPSASYTEIPIDMMDDPPSPVMEDPPTPDLPPTALPAIYDPSFGGGFPPGGGLGDMSSLFNPEMMQMFQGAGGPGGPDGASPFAPQQQGPPVAAGKPLIARLVPLVHMIAITAMFYLTMFVWEPSVWASGARRGNLDQDWKAGGGRAGRWRSLRGDTGAASDILTSGFAGLVSLLTRDDWLTFADIAFLLAARVLGVRHPGDTALQHRNIAYQGTSTH